MIYRFFAFIYFNSFLTRHQKLAAAIALPVCIFWVFGIPYLVALAISHWVGLWTAKWVFGPVWFGWAMFTLWRLKKAEHRLRHRPDYWGDEPDYW